MSTIPGRSFDEKPLLAHGLGVSDLSLSARSPPSGVNSVHSRLDGANIDQGDIGLSEHPVHILKDLHGRAVNDRNLVNRSAAPVLLRC